MAFINHCFFCSLLAAAAAGGVYVSVAYLIAFGIQLWWVVGTRDFMPAPAYILCAGYLIVLLMSLIMLIGLALKRPRYLLAWLLAMIMFFFPEMGMVLFLSIYHWNIESNYGLGDLIFYICRAGLNLVSVLCVQSLYATWREETYTLSRLEALTLKVDSALVPNGVTNRAFSKDGSIAYSNGVPPALIRSASSASQYAALRHHYAGRSEFNAANFGLPVGRTQSALGISAYPAYGLEAPPLIYLPRCVPANFATQSLDRRKYMKGPRRSSSMDALNLGGPHVPHVTALGGPHVPGVIDWDWWLAHSRHTHESKSSLGAESDSHRYRDVAL